MAGLVDSGNRRYSLYPNWLFHSYSGTLLGIWVLILFEHTILLDNLLYTGFDASSPGLLIYFLMETFVTLVVAESTVVVTQNEPFSIRVLEVNSGMELFYQTELTILGYIPGIIYTTIIAVNNEESRPD